MMMDAIDGEIGRYLYLFVSSISQDLRGLDPDGESLFRSSD